ncbi:MAG: (2Fe-2S)-binding protein [Firmicutes bacterium]|nr:(2Fe-2S)-binding protein [Bacillota bacterium]
MKKSISLTINGTKVDAEVDQNITLLSFIRDEMGLMGTKEGCGTGDCGACTVIIDGLAVKSCIYLAVEADGKEITTIEGLSIDGELHPIQQAFVEEGAVQCGFCIPGTILSAKALLDENEDPTEEEIKKGIAGNLCRCTGYVRIIKAIKKSAKVLQKAK